MQTRLGSEDGLTFCELSYQLMQGYDFLHLYQNFGVNIQVKSNQERGMISIKILRSVEVTNGVI